MNPKLRAAMEAINKTYGEGSIAIASKAHLDIERVPFGIFSLDIETGGGMPKGRIINLHGPFSGGKSYVAMCAIKSIQTFMPPPLDMAVLVDAENVFDRVWARDKVGIDLDRLLIVQPSTGEVGFDIAEELYRSHAVGIVVVDSIASMTPTKEAESSIEEQQMGLQARLVNKWIRKIVSASMPSKENGMKKNQGIVLLVNQERQTMNQYHPITTPGGNGKDFAASMTITIRKGTWIADTATGKKVVGQQVMGRTEKNKVFARNRDFTFDMYFAEGGPIPAGGVDTTKMVMQYGIEHGFIVRRGSMYDFKGQTYKGSEVLAKALDSHPDWVDEVRQKVLATLNGEINKSPVKLKKKFVLGKKK